MGGAPGVGVLTGRCVGKGGGVWRMKYMKRRGNCVVAGIFCEARRRYKKARQMAT